MYLKKSEYLYFEKISAKRISIRELDICDINDIYELFRNDNVTKYLGIDTFKDKESAQSLIGRAINQYRNKEIYYLGITLNENDKIIGYIGLSRYDLTPTTCQVVYALNERYWGLGLASEALELFNNYLFEIHNKQIIIATHIDKNMNSGKVMLKAGMKRDKEYDQEMVIKGIREKLIGYSIKKE